MNWILFTINYFNLSSCLLYWCCCGLWFTLISITINHHREQFCIHMSIYGIFYVLLCSHSGDLLFNSFQIVIYDWSNNLNFEIDLIFYDYCSGYLRVNFLLILKQFFSQLSFIYCVFFFDFFLFALYAFSLEFIFNVLFQFLIFVLWLMECALYCVQRK